MREQQYQAKIIKKYEAHGYFVLNLIKTNCNGIPDLLCLKANEAPMFIEIKAKKGVVSKLQEYRIKQLKEKGFVAFVDRQP